MKKENKILANVLEKVGRAAVKADSDKRCVIYMHQPKTPDGIKKFLSSK